MPVWLCAPKCRRVRSEYEAARRTAVRTLAQESAAIGEIEGDSWSVEEAEKAFFKRLDREQKQAQSATIKQDHTEELKPGRRLAYPVSNPLAGSYSIAVGYCNARGEAGVSDKQSNIGLQGSATAVVRQSLEQERRH
jgi:hypothetical protein